jgi:high affinity cGMP-specific 3',5'-cyclic phosphodiesterase 9
MANLFLTQGELTKVLELDHIDIMSFLTAAVCHDLGHDGFTNGYHCNACTTRAIRYNDVSVQENYHVAEAFTIIKRDGTNFLDQLTNDEFKVVRKRMIGCILATDMAKHASDLSALKSLVETKNIKNGENAQ